MNNEIKVMRKQVKMARLKKDSSDCFSIYWDKAFHERTKAFAASEPHCMSLSWFLHIAAVELMRKWSKKNKI